MQQNVHWSGGLAVPLAAGVILLAVGDSGEAQDRVNGGKRSVATLPAAHI
jgi:hypothetical protein